MEFLGRVVWAVSGVSPGWRSRVREELLNFLEFMMTDAKHMGVSAWVRPVVQVASMCQHFGDTPRHKVYVFDQAKLVRELSDGVAGPVAVVPLGGIQVGRFGLVLKGFAALDIWAVMRNVIWEDEHCVHCCGAMLRFVEPLQHEVLVRCGPTIGSTAGSSGTPTLGSVVDEYWTD